MSIKNRKKATDVCVSLVSELYPGTENGELTRRMLDGFSDEEFTQYMEGLRSGKELIPVTVPNFQDTKFNEEHFLNFGKKHGIKFFQHLKVTDPDTGRIFKTPLRYLIIRDRVNRLVQMLEDKASFPMDNNHVDELSGQVTGKSKGARLSFPEFNNIRSKGFKAFLVETMSLRGGNAQGLRAFEDELRKNGSASIGPAIMNSDGAKSKHTLAAYLRAMHFGTTLDSKD